MGHDPERQLHHRPRRVEAGGARFKAKITLEGQPAGFTVDDGRRMFYTNLEDKDRTLAIDVKTRKVTHTWVPSCGEGGPTAWRSTDRPTFCLWRAQTR